MENLKKTLYLEKEESVPVYELLSVVAAQYNMTAEHYCEVCILLYIPRSALNIYGCVLAKDALVLFLTSRRLRYTSIIL